MSDTDTTTCIADHHGGVGGRPWQLAWTSYCRWPHTPLTAVAVGSVAGRPGGRRQRLQRTL